MYKTCTPGKKNFFLMCLLSWKDSIYDKSAINFTYARLFQKESASQFIMKNARRIVVEDWIYDPKGYDPKQRLIEVEKKLYLNSYVPSDLVAEIGDSTRGLCFSWWSRKTKQTNHTKTGYVDISRM